MLEELSRGQISLPPDLFFGHRHMPDPRVTLATVETSPTSRYICTPTRRQPTQSHYFARASTSQACKIPFTQVIRKGCIMPHEIVFGFMTAIQACRSSRIDWKKLTISHQRQCPAKEPSAKELAHAVECMERLYPGIVLKPPFHYLVNKSSLRHSDSIRHPHSFTSTIPSSSIVRLADGIYAATPPFAFAQECTRQNYADRLRIAWEICGTYQSGLCGLPAAYNTPPLSSVVDMRNYARRNSHINGGEIALRSLRYTADGSASPRESQLGLTLGLLTRYGGAGLGIPRMNFGVSTTPGARAICGKSELYLDLSWPHFKYDIEYQSDETHGDGMRTSDSRRENALESMGFTVISITTEEFNSFRTTVEFANLLRKRFGKRHPPSFDDYHARQLKLRRDLGMPVGFEL